MKGTIDWQRTDWPFRLLELEVDLARTALLIVDMQNKFADNLAKVTPNNARLLSFFRDHRLPVTFVRVGSLLPDSRDVHLKRRLTWLRSASGPPNVCPRGTFDYDVVEALQPLPGELVVDKNCQGAFNSSPIDHYLQARGVQTLVVTGVATSHCVEGTARDAADRGYNVILVDDACNDRERHKHQGAMHTFARLFGTVKSTEEVIADLSRLLVEEHNLGWC